MPGSNHHPAQPLPHSRRAPAAASDGGDALTRDPLATLAGGAAEIGTELRRLTNAVELVASVEALRSQRTAATKLEYFRELHELINEFAESALKGADAAKTALDKAKELGATERLLLREARGVRSDAVKKWDTWSAHCGAQAATVDGFFKALEHYKAPETQTQIEAALGETDDPATLSENIEFLEREFGGLSRVCTELLACSSHFPKWCTELAKDVREFDISVRDRVGEAEDDEEEGKKTFNFADLFKPPPDKKYEVQVYRSNPHLTLLLAELLDRLPSPGTKATAEDGLALGISRYREELMAASDKGILEWARTQQMYMRMSRVVEHTHAALLSAVTAATDTELREGLERSPSANKSSYDRVREDSSPTGPGAQAGIEVFRSFDSTPIREFLFDFRPYRKTPNQDGEKGKESLEGEADERNGKFEQMFAKLEALLERLADTKKPVEKAEVEKEIGELVELKRGVAKSEEQRSKARLTRDKKVGNYAFEPRQGGYGVLALHRVPTDNVRYDEVVGRSWGKVQERLEPLVRHGELGYLYNLGSMRGRQNSNMLIVGPYGCGKNMFLRALMADPRTVGIKVTLDRLSSVWHSQSERNIRKVFEAGHEKGIELEKPVVIGWDEFDTLYCTGKGGSLSDSISERMQKILQSVLDGDTVFEGVSLIALTNKPSAIPPPIYRRFANVVVIEPLNGQERRDLLQKMVAGLPRAAGFDETVAWDGIIERTEFASGDLLGKIYDQAFLSFIRKVEAKTPTGLHAANARFKELALAGKSVGAAERFEIFSDCAGNVVLTAEEYQSAAETVLKRLVVQQAMEQARLFYEVVEERMQEAFKGVE